MLVLTRKKGQSIMIGKDIKITLVETGDTVRIGIDAPPQWEIFRMEIYQQIQQENASSLTNPQDVLAMLRK
jgi:carbon storage regulator